MNRRLLTLLCLTAFVLPVWIMNGSCGQPIPPTGGPRDSLPPVFVKSDPRDSALRVKENRITLEFNEYVQVEKAYENVIVSPVPKQAPQVDAKLKQIIIKLHDTLEPNTTYTIDFGNAIKDINENNVLKHFKYTFSTGDHLDSARLSGKAVIAETGKPDTTIIVVLHRSADDSAVAKERPRYFTRTNAKGEFQFTGLSAGTYHAFALKDVDNSRKYDQVSEMIGFLERPVVTGQGEAIRFYVFQGIDERKPYKPIATPKPAATPAPPRDKDDHRLKYGNNLENGQQDLLGKFILTFENPVTRLDSSKLILTDDQFKPLPYRLSTDSTHLKVYIDHPWKEATMYKVILQKDIAGDSLGNAVMRTDTITVNARRESEYAGIDIRFSGLDSATNPVLNLYRNDALELSRRVDANRIRYRIFHPGDYEIRILFDRNRNGKWDTGDYWKKLQPEKILSRPQKWSVRANMDNELTINLSEEPD
jgi:uncharacterized protein (DUF2141 family)